MGALIQVPLGVHWLLYPLASIMWHCEAGGTFYGHCIFLPAVTPVSISWSFYVAHIPGPPLSRYPDIELKPQSRKIRLFISPWVTIYQGGWNCASFCTQNREFMLCFVEIETRFTVLHCLHSSSKQFNSKYNTTLKQKKWGVYWKKPFHCSALC